MGEPQQTSPHITDVAVIGGGVVGLSCAAELARRGRQVTVFDQGDVGRGCGAGSAGHLVPSHILPLAAPGMQAVVMRALLRSVGAVSIDRTTMMRRPRWAVDFTRACQRSNYESGAWALRHLAAISGSVVDEIRSNQPELHIEQRGLLDVYRSGAAFAAAQHHAEELEVRGVRTDVLDGDEVRSREPLLTGEVAGGLLFPDDSSVKPIDLLNALIRRACDLGVESRPDTRVLGLLVNGDRITGVRTSQGDWRVSEVVIANGAAAGQFGAQLGVRLPIVGGRGHSITFARDDAFDVRQPLLLGEDHVAVGPYHDQVRFSGYFEIGAADTAPSLSKTDALVAAARTRLRLPESMTVLERWSGLRPVTPDTLPIIGRPGCWKNVAVAAGHAMVGLSYGPGTGRVVAELVTGEAPSIDLARFACERFS